MEVRIKTKIKFKAGRECVGTEAGLASLRDRCNVGLTVVLLHEWYCLTT